MDRYISLEDRQRGVSLAGDLSQQIEANRQRQMATADLGGPPEPAPVAALPAPTPRATPVPPKPRPTPVAEAPVAPKVAKPAPAAPAKPIPTGGTWKIQLGAFGVPGNADAQWNRVKGLPEVSGHPRINLPTGKVTRLMAGGYSEDGAKAACRKLVASGNVCIPAQN
jgi:cell division septation protein DedD